MFVAFYPEAFTTLTGIGMRAATSGTGRSLRQIERRIKTWTGQPMRDLNAYERSELLYSYVLEASQRGMVDLAGAALDASYFDQSPMGRYIKRQTGFSPEKLRRLIETDEALWAYRLLGQRF